MTEIFNYHFQETLSESTRTLIYRGYRKADQTPLIFKILNQPEPTPRAIARFKTEYDITRTLNLRGVIRVHGLEPYHHTWMILEEDFGGVDLSQLLKQQPFSIETVLSITIQAAKTLGNIHTRRIIHKDINPANWLLNPGTGQLKLIDFGLAVVGTREMPLSQNPYVLEGTPAYLSPEQTGRTNRPLDHRTDLYSLGCMLYELLTGQRPFETTDLVELVHCHLARQPIPPHHLQAHIPEALSDIVLKLMSKMAEDRYQNAAGLVADLRRCQIDLANQGEVKRFFLGARDVHSGLKIPQKLYGREAEVAQLSRIFQQVIGGANRAEQPQSHLVLVSGAAGVGKTTLVQELYPVLTQQRGYYIAGKFDQYQRDTPYSALIDAFSDLIRQLLMEPNNLLQQWRDRMMVAVGSNGCVLTDLIPALETLIGPQPPAPLVGFTEAQNRFKQVFQAFIQVFTQPEHPLVLFLDDLQWADRASLQLIQTLLLETQSACLLIVGTHRNKLLPLSQPLIECLDHLQQHPDKVHSILLSPLNLTQTLQLLTDTLDTSPALLHPLATLVQEKTGGNPFFLRQFLTQLHREQWLHYNPRRGCWEWDLQDIQQREMTSNVLELLADRLHYMPQAEQQMLQWAACVGNTFDLQVLSQVCEQSPQITAAQLQTAIDHHLIHPLGSTYPLVHQFLDTHPDLIGTIQYQFVHDRVQQAAYLLTPPEDRPRRHYQMGRLLLTRWIADSTQVPLFDIVNHFNLGLDLLQDCDRKQVAQLNLQASQKAKASTAYHAAFQFAQVGIDLIGEAGWQYCADLAMALYSIAAETAYLSGDLVQLESLAAVVQHHAQTPLEAVAVDEIRIQARSSQAQFRAALDLALSRLQELGLMLPRQPDAELIQELLTRVDQQIAQTPIASLVNLPPMTDPTVLAMMRLMSAAIAPAYIAAPEFLPLLVGQQVLLSIRCGTAPASPFAYAMYGLILCGVIFDIDTGDALGQLALQLVEQRFDPAMYTRTLMVVHTNITPWKRALRETLAPLQRAYQVGVEHGDFEFAGYAVVNRIYYLYQLGCALPELQQELLQARATLIQLQQTRNLDMLNLYLQVVQNWTAPSQSEPDTLTGDYFNEPERIAHLQANNDRFGLFQVYLHKLTLAYHWRKLDRALTYAQQARQYLDGVVGLALVPSFYCLEALTHLATYLEKNPAEQAATLQQVEQSQTLLRRWADQAPMNFLHYWHLVEAKRCHVTENEGQALDHLEQAIQLAETHHYWLDLSLAYQMAARFYRRRRNSVVARAYLQESRAVLRRWGGLSQIQYLEKTYSKWLPPSSTNSPTLSQSTSSSESTAALDLTTLMKASQTIARELVLERLMVTLLQVTLENVGAERGALLLLQEQELSLMAALVLDSATSETTLVTVAQPGDWLPLSVAHYVARTQETVVLADAVQPGHLFQHDVYIQQQQPHSILCVPLVNQGHLVGVVYLENNLLTAAFTPERVEVLSCLSTQMAIALENARLLDQQANLNQALQRERTQMAQMLERITDGFLAVNSEWQIIYANQQAEDILGRPRETLLGQLLWDTQLSEGHSHEHYQEALKSGQPLHLEDYSSTHQSWLAIHAYPDKHGLSIFFQDITKRKKMEERLIYDARHDALTGLPNRLHLIEKLSEVLQQGQANSENHFAVLFLDVDRFKVINDSLGHLVGDLLLIALGQRLRRAISTQDLVARLGSDEFVILLQGPVDVVRVAAQIQTALHEPFDLDGYTLTNTVSIGIVPSLAGYSLSEEVLQAADIAMYQAKAEGKARYTVFNSAMQEQVQSVLKLEHDLRQGIERRELMVYYQPIIHLPTGELAGFEALVRWQHPSEGLISPVRFIPLAEETGLIVPIGQWVLQEACHQLQRWQAAFPKGDRLRMSVNLSVKQFSQTDLLESIDEALRCSGLRGEQLKIEITESALMSSATATQELLQALRDRHIQICIDDFGTGYSSLSYLHQFPVDVLKIDRSFTQGIDRPGQKAEVVKTLLTLAYNLDMEAIAEGIETKEQLTLLRQSGCPYGQGYLFAPPLPTDTAESFIKTWQHQSLQIYEER